MILWPKWLQPLSSSSVKSMTSTGVAALIFIVNEVDPLNRPLAGATGRLNSSASNAVLVLLQRDKGLEHVEALPAEKDSLVQLLSVFVDVALHTQVLRMVMCRKGGVEVSDSNKYGDPGRRK